ncbi:hypothetical protein NPIL_698591 [Nephila pilipes]|uniref:Uncharacterized protein n=1 Tax=Nephila pilipes TaxID=299642 RepID=A0A8X6MW59_NEPPI|nr:hypothetical protein NPIL_698591 [Nephila pilipes]
MFMCCFFHVNSCIFSIRFLIFEATAEYRPTRYFMMAMHVILGWDEIRTMMGMDRIANGATVLAECIAGMFVPVLFQEIFLSSSPFHFQIIVCC